MVGLVLLDVSSGQIFRGRLVGRKGFTGQGELRD